MRYFDVLTSHHSSNLLGGYIYSYNAPITAGVMVEIPFRDKREIGVVYKELKSVNYNHKKIKAITGIASNNTVPGDIIKLCQYISRYYCTSLGETIFDLIPDCKNIINIGFGNKPRALTNSREIIVGHFQKRLLRYLDIISRNNESTLLLLPNYRMLDIVKRYLTETMTIPSVAEISDRLGNKEYARTLSMLKDDKIKVTLSTRGGVKLLGFGFQNIIIDDPLNYGFFNDRKPAYSTRHLIETLQQYASVKLYLGGSSVDPESVLQMRRGKTRLTTLTTDTRPAIKWCETKTDTVINSLNGKINLIVCPYAQSADVKSDGSYLRVDNIARQIKDNVVYTQANKPLVVPPARPINIVATKKILDHQELLFDETLILGLDTWLSLPGADNIYDLLDMIWRLTNQTKKVVYLQSTRPIPVLEEMLGMGVNALNKFMKSRHTFKLPPYSRKIDIYAKKPRSLTVVTDRGINTVIEPNKLSTYIERDDWPLSDNDAEALYRQCDKVTVDAP